MESRRKRMVGRPEQETVSQARDFVGKFMKRGDLVIEFCTSACRTAKTCMLHNQNRLFWWMWYGLGHLEHCKA